MVGSQTNRADVFSSPAQVTDVFGSPAQEYGFINFILFELFQLVGTNENSNMIKFLDSFFLNFQTHCVSWPECSVARIDQPTNQSSAKNTNCYNSKNLNIFQNFIEIIEELPSE